MPLDASRAQVGASLVKGIGARDCQIPVAMSMRLTLFTRLPLSTPPAIGSWVIDLRDSRRGWERRCASEDVQFPVKHRAAGAGDGRWYWRARAPGVSRDVVDLHIRHFSAAIVTADNVELAADGS